MDTRKLPQLFCVIAATLTVAAAPAVAAPLPNVVVIMTDDQTLDSLRFMPKVLSLLGSEGTTFDNNFVSFPLCCPSRATFLTGQYSHNHGVNSNNPPLGGYTQLDHTNTLAVWLQAAGYHTTHIGKYLNGYGTGGVPQTEIPPGWSDWQATVGFSAYKMYGYTVNENGTLVQYSNAPADYQTDVLAARAVAALHARALAGGPFFMWIAPLAPHAEAGGDGPRAAPRHEGVFAAEPLPMPPSFNEADVSDKPHSIANLPSLTPAQVTSVTARYRDRLESLLAVDDLVEGVYNQLAADGLLANTYLIFTSDNGFFQGEHRVKQGKTKLYEESVRVPLIVRGPGFAAGAHNSALVANIDLAASLVAWTGATPARVLDGRNLRLAANHPGTLASRTILLENGDESTGARYTDGIRTRRYVYLEWRFPTKPTEFELYDLSADAYQLTNLHGDAAYAAIEASLAQKLGELKVCAGGACDSVRYP